MEQLNSEVNYDNFWASLARSDRALLLLDYDGTLAPFVDDPMQAFPYPGVRDRLAEISRSGRTRLVMVSGRPVDDLRELLGITPLPELWGSHGLEHLSTDGAHSVRELPDSVWAGFRAIRLWVERQKLYDLTEYKISGAAFHWRPLSPDAAEELRRKAHERWDESAPRYGFDLHEFDGGLELRVAGITKANAVADVLSQSGPGIPAAFLGDDLTDEDGFRAMKGRGLSVLVRRKFRSTEADIWIIPPDELLAFLDAWIASSTRNRPPASSV